MKKENFTIVISFFCIWFTAYFSPHIQTVSAFLLIITFGILHGSNDIVLLNKINQSSASYSIQKLLLSYVLLVFVTVALFYYIPAAGLLTFIMVSSFHFGEQHWSKKLTIENSIIKKGFEFFYGLFILFLLFNFQPTEVKKVVFAISSIDIATNFIFYTFICIGVIVVSGAVLLSILDSNFKKIATLEGFYIIMFALLFKMTTLIWGFAIYFIFWHSIPSLMDQVQYLHGSWTIKNFVLYCKSAFWYWMISILGIAILYYTLGEKELFEGLFFSFLAAITFPHVLVIIRMNYIKDEN